MSYTYPTEELLELAFAAYRVNNGYVKRTTMAYEEGKTSTWANKELISFTAGIQNNAWLPETFVPLEVTDKDRENTQRAHKYFQKYTMLILGNSLSDFQKDMYQAYSNKQGGKSEFGLIAYIPEFIERESDNIAYKQHLKEHYSNSECLTGKSLQGNIQILKTIYVAKFELYVYIAGYDKNLVSFAKKEKLDPETQFYITAKIKDADTERDTGIPMTKINYVKIQQLENT